MATTDPFGWRFDWEPTLHPEYPIRILQREIRDARDLEEDLLPYRAGVGRWSLADAQGHVSARGILTESDLTAAANVFVVRTTGGDIHRLELREPLQCILTVWRVAEQLDLLQLKLVGRSAEVQAEIGGDRLLPLLASIKMRTATDLTAREVITLYETGDVPPSLSPLR